MTGEHPETIKREARDARKQAEAAEHAAETSQLERREDAARPVRYLWPVLSSLWQAGAR